MQQCLHLTDHIIYRYTLYCVNSNCMHCVNLHCMYIYIYKDRVAEVVDSKHFGFIVGKCDPLTAQLTLVAALGLKGVNCLKLAVQHVPDSFGERKIKHVSAILQSVLHTN